MDIKVIKFSSTWCGPCKQMEPIFDNVSKLKDFKNFTFQKYDIEEDTMGIELVEKYSIRNIPTIVITDNNGNVMKKIIGFVNENELTNILKEFSANE